MDEQLSSMKKISVGNKRCCLEVRSRAEFHNVIHGIEKREDAHKACVMAITLWAHLRMDHMLGWARQWGHLALFSAFKGEGRHKALKNEISKRSFRGGAKGHRISRLRWARSARARKGECKRKRWAEAIHSDNLY